MVQRARSVVGRDRACQPGRVATFLATGVLTVG
jgi:hypothetical protein